MQRTTDGCNVQLWEARVNAMSAAWEDAEKRHADEQPQAPDERGVCTSTYHLSNPMCELPQPTAALQAWVTSVLVYRREMLAAEREKRS